MKSLIAIALLALSASASADYVATIQTCAATHGLDGSYKIDCNTVVVPSFVTLTNCNNHINAVRNATTNLVIDSENFFREWSIVRGACSVR